MPRPSASPALRVLRTLRTGSRMTLRRHKDFLALAALCRKSPATADYSPSGHSALPWLAANELLNLTDRGIASITLSSDNVERTPDSGIFEFGRGEYTTTDGEVAIFADTQLDYEEQDQAFLGETIFLGDNLNGDILQVNQNNANIDLNILANMETATLSTIELSGHGANTLLANLEDLIELTDDNNTLFINGDSDDSVILDAPVADSEQVIFNDTNYHHYNWQDSQLLIEEGITVEHIVS